MKTRFTKDKILKQYLFSKVLKLHLHASIHKNVPYPGNWTQWCKSHSDGIGFKGMKGSWRAVEAWHWVAGLEFLSRVQLPWETPAVLEMPVPCDSHWKLQLHYMEQTGAWKPDPLGKPRGPWGNPSIELFAVWELGFPCPNYGCALFLPSGSRKNSTLKENFILDITGTQHREVLNFLRESFGVSQKI